MISPESLASLDLSAAFASSDFSDLPIRVVAALKKAGMTVATAESCTGGYIAKRITDVSGASAVLEGSVVTYSCRIKEALIGVQHKTIAQYGVVSIETAMEMAAGVRRVIGSDIGISITGVAGPDGGTAETPVGTVCLGWATDKGTNAEVLHIAPQTHDPREYIRYMATNYSLQKILTLIMGNANR